MCGYSRIIIDWLTKTSKLQAATLEGWKSKVENLLSSFTRLDALHIYREYNQEANALSKGLLFWNMVAVMLQNSCGDTLCAKFSFMTF